MEDRRGDKPWYLTDRARWLAYIYFTQDETIRVDDVSDLDVGVDLLVRPGVGREEEDWIMGVVTDGAVSFPEDSEETGDGVWISSSELELPSFSELPDIPVLFAYYTMSDERGYGILVSNGSTGKLLFPNGLTLTVIGKSNDLTGPFTFLSEAIYHQLLASKTQRALPHVFVQNGSESGAESDSGPSSAKNRNDLRVIPSLFSSGTSSD